jgi:hypothetical protein
MKMPSYTKPLVGDLVKLDDLACKELDYWGKESDQVGVVIECTGIRCKVQWTNGLTTHPERSALEVINASR